MSTEVSESAARPDGRRLRWTQHRADRRAGFVAAGADAIDLHGPEVSAEQIAEIAGVSRTVLYRYFRDRDDLRQAIAEHIVDVVVASVLPSLVLTPDATPRQVIRGGIEVIIGWLDEHPNLYYFLRSERSGGPGADGLAAVENTLATKVAALLKLMLVLFGLDVEQAEPGAHGIVGLVEASGAWWLSTRSLPRERFTDIVCTSVWHLLEGTARDNNIQIGYDDPLPIPQLTTEE